MSSTVDVTTYETKTQPHSCSFLCSAPFSNEDGKDPIITIDSQPRAPTCTPIICELLSEAISDTKIDNRPEEYYKYSTLKGKVICIEGNISAGKTTAGRNVATYLESIGLHAVFIQEEVNESFLALFYSGPEKYAFAFQMYMLRTCIEALKLATRMSHENGTIVVTDRGLWGNHVFAALQKEKGNMNSKEWNAYLSVMKDALNNTTEINIDTVLYLDCSPSICYGRLVDRGRNSEVSGIKLEYLEELEKCYSMAMFIHIKQHTSNVIPLIWEKFKPIECILDALISTTRYTVTGDVQIIYSLTRKTRKEYFKKLLKTGYLNL